MRSKVQKEMMMKEREKKELQLRELASRARSERTDVAPPPAAPERGRPMNDDDMSVDYEHARDYPKESREEREKRLKREKIREERRRERERERRLEAKEVRRVRSQEIEIMILVKKWLWEWPLQAHQEERSCTTKDCSTRIKAWILDLQLTMPTTCMIRAYLLLSLLFLLYTGLRKMLIPKCMEVPMSSWIRSERQIVSERAGQRGGAVEFEKEKPVEEADPFGLDQFLTEVKKGKKAMDKVGSMRASAAATRDGYESSSRSRIAFDKGR